MAHIISADEILLETRSFYQKGSYRNRCHIYGANGLLRLSVPLRHGKNQRKRMGEVEISYDHPWQSLHWESLCSAYRSSPYFEYYEDDLKPVFKYRPPYLMDFNLRLMDTLCDLMGIDFKPESTLDYQDSYDGWVDLRERIHPKPGRNDIRALKFDPYIQVFGRKHGFLPDLSILDLLFHEGPASVEYLRSCIGSGFIPE